MKIESQDFLYITSDIIRKFISLQDIIKTVEEVYRAHGNGEAYLSDPPGMFLKEREGQLASFKVKGASIPSQRVAGLRLLGFTPNKNGIGENMTYGYSYLVDPDTAAPLAFINESYQYILRTGATAAINLYYLGKKNSNSVGIIGAGRVGKASLESLNQLISLNQVKVYDFYKEFSETFAEEMGNRLKINIETVNDPELAVRDLDLVITATSADTALVQPGWLAEGSTLCSLGQGQEIDHKVLSEVDKLVVDDFEFCTMLGDIHAWISKGYLTELEIRKRVYGTICEIVTGNKVARETDHEKIMVIPQGMSSLDLAIARLVYDRFKDSDKVQKIIIKGAN